MRRKRQNRKGTAGRVLCPLAAFVLAAAFIIGTPPLSGAAWAVELERECSFQVMPVTEGGSIPEGQPGEKVDVAIDLYLVAEAWEIDGYDTYDYHVATDSPYYAGIAAFVSAHEGSGWQSEEDSTGLIFRYSPEAGAEGEGWEALAREAAAVGLGESAGLLPTVTGEAGSRLSGLEAGLYLVVARGSSLDGKADYVTELDTEEGGREIATIAYTDDYVYRFSPQMISLPTKEAAEGNASTSDTGEWIYDLGGLELKFDLDSRYVSLEIVKEITRYGAPATFVFEVEASQDGRVVYSDVVALSFDENSGRGKSVILEDKIPAGADVTVSEVYAGASYSLTGIRAEAVGGIPEGTSYTVDLASGRAVITAISAGNMGGADEEGSDIGARVTFTNDYNGSGNSGGAIANHFERDGADGEWSWNQYQYNAGSGMWEWNGTLPAVTENTVR